MPSAVNEKNYQKTFNSNQVFILLKIFDFFTFMEPSGANEKRYEIFFYTT